MKNDLAKILKETAAILGLDSDSVKLDYPENPEHGDFTTNLAMVNAKKSGMSPRELAQKILEGMSKKDIKFIKEISIAGPGFLNFFVDDLPIFHEILRLSGIRGKVFDLMDFRHKSDSGRRIMVEYTDPNAFKVFHIGHLMSNAIGESISRLIEYSGTSVIRICYPSDIGLHIAKAIWAMRRHADEIPRDAAPIQERTDFLGKMYVLGTAAYENEKNKLEIDELNKALYQKSDPAVNELYEKGRKWSLDHFELLYKILGTKFDEYIFESQMAGIGLDIARDALKDGILEKSEGAIVFKGERYGLHTRVFVNGKGIPTYEAKDLGLNITKFRKYPAAERSIIVTASEQNDYFKVLSKVLSLIDEKNGSRTEHIGHGMMRFLSGKMSSRTGNVVTAESLLRDIKDLVLQKIAGRNFDEKEAAEIADIIAVGAIKYTILRSSIGGDIIFDSASSISFEGDSGPYLQYAAVRANSILEKAAEQGVVKWQGGPVPGKATDLERIMIRFGDIVERARMVYSPQHVANYLMSLAGEFNRFYASQVIVDNNDPLSPYYVEATRLFHKIITEGLWILGIRVPKQM